MRKVAFFRLIGLSFRTGYRAVLALLCAGISAACLIFIPRLVGDCVDIAAAGNLTALKENMPLLIGLFAIFAAAGYFHLLLSGSVAARTAELVRRRLTGKINRLPIAAIDGERTGSAVSAFVSDTDRVFEGVQQVYSVFFNGIVVLVGSLAAMAVISPRIALMVAGVAPVAVLLAAIVSGRSSRMYRLQQNTMAEYGGFVLEAVSNLDTVRLYSYQEELSRKEADIAEKLRDTNQRAMFVSSLANPGTRFINNIAYVLVGLIGGLIAAGTGSITVGMISAMITYSAQFAKPLNEMTQAASHFLAAEGAGARIFAILDSPDEEDGGEDIGRAEGRIEFRGVDFAYLPDRPLIRDFNLSVDKGKTVAIVGPTGAGKSTLVNLIMRFYDADKGAVLLDGKDIRQISRRALRANIAMVLQEVRLFDGTIAQNIAFGCVFDPERAERAAKAAYCDGFIHQMPEGFESVITQDGTSLSQGQKQLITIARAVYKDAPVLIFDEATSNVDSRTELLIRNALNVLMKDRTSFIIAHRLSTIVSADIILYMRNGRIEESGSHSELMAQRGYYYAMFMSQFEGGAPEDGQGAQNET